MGQNHSADPNRTAGGGGEKRKGHRNSDSESSSSSSSHGLPEVAIAGPNSSNESYSNSNNNNDNDGDQDPQQHSPESAGLARGLARSAASRGVGSAATGRLPLSASRMRMANIRRVARVSDRASTGLDLLGAHQESSSSTTATTKNKTNSNNNNNASSSSIIGSSSSWRSRVVGFAGSLAKNTVLGATVFGVYEEVIDWFEGLAASAAKLQQQQEDVANATASLPQRRETIVSFPDETASGDAAPSPAPPTMLWQHFAAGSCSGSVHACLGWLLERAAALAGNQRLPTLPSPAGVLRDVVSHAVLFGSYEAIKRGATGWSQQLQQQQPFEPPSERSGGVWDDGRLVAVAVAGGLAGISQQLAADAIEPLAAALQTNQQRRVSTTKETTNTTMTKTVRKVVAAMPRYSARSLGMVSVPTAIGFVAFEYGREAVLAD